ncbi:MAG TPA: alpha/beta fold hydrolase [Usitatibacter sp.]|nr:alpha/beta fold hydrolase [Usitatibacter sp.]
MGSSQGIMHRAALAAIALFTVAFTAAAADYPPPREAWWTARDFRFHTGEVMPELKIHYQTVGDPKGEPVLVLHGTAGSSASMLTPGFAGELFGPGQPLDASRYFIVIPDAIGTGKSTKPSDGLRTKFPHYDYDDMVEAQHRLVTEGLGIRHLRLVIGNSMGGMQAWMWAEKYPGMLDIAVPMASLPAPMSGRNWMLRRMLVESIRSDPEYMDGNYTKQPHGLQVAAAFFATATNGGNRGLYKLAPTREKGDAAVKQRMTGPFNADANDYLYQWESSADYDPSAGLERIEAAVLAINAADDERNPPELGVLDREMRRVKNGRVLLIPASDQTTGHGTTGNARLYKAELDEVLRSAPHR